MFPNNLPNMNMIGRTVFMQFNLLMRTSREISRRHPPPLTWALMAATLFFD